MFKQLKTITFALFIFPSLCLAGPDLEAIRQQYQLPSLGLTVMKDTGNVSRIAGVRKWDDGTPATIYDQYHLGSDTKAMTATLVAIYVQRGMLSWKTTMAQAFPEFADKMDPQLKNITIDKLTSHMSGISGDALSFNHGKLWRSIIDPNLDPQVGRLRVARVVLSTKPEAPPGTKFIYSNLNYIIVGAILEKITHQSWETLMRENIFEPLDMPSCGFGTAGTATLPPDQPWGHTRSDTGPSPITPGFNGDNPPTLGPAGTVHCSMGDWAKFLRIHLNGFNGNSSKILSAQGFVKLHTPYPGQEYTYGGWGYVQRDWAGGPALTHSGSNTYNLVTVWLAPLKKFGVLSVTNIGDNNAFLGTDQAISEAITANQDYLKRH